MKKNKSVRIPKFNSYKEEAKFWDAHEVTEFLDELKPAALQFPKPRMKLVSMRLPEPEIIGLKQLASRKGIGYLTLIRIWITERFFREIKKAV